MKQDSTFNYQPTKEQIYKEREIWVGALLGGTLAAGYMVASNYKSFGETDKVRKTWFVTIAATAFLFYIAFFAPYLDRVPNQLFSLIYAGIIIVLVQMYQGEKIRMHIRGGGQIHSWWKTLGVSILGVVITMILILSMAYLLTIVENVHITSKTYGTVKHDIAFDKNNISETEIDKIAKGLTQTNFFDNEKPKAVDAKKVGDDYEITIYCNETIKTNPESIRYFRDLRSEMQKLFPNSKISFNLVISTPDNIIKRIE